MMDHLDYFLHFKDSLKKIPHLVLVGSGLDRGTGVETVLGALLIYEFRVLGCGSGVFATDDASGRRTLIAPVAIRTAVARRAAGALMERGARLVFQTFLEERTDEAALLPWPLVHGSNGRAANGRGAGRPEDWRLATQRRLLRAYLPLLSTFDETLSKIGQRTRSNMRYYRRRAEAHLGCVFVPDAHPTRFEVKRFNRECTYAVPDTVAGWRYDAITTVPGGFLCGIRADGPGGDGRWLAMLGGRRYHDTVEIDWQMNRADLPVYSLSTVLRAYLIEHEIARGTRQLFVEGGTPHAMRFSFAMQMVRDFLVVRRSGWISTLAPKLARLVPLLQSYINRSLPQSAFILKIVMEPQLTWREWSEHDRRGNLA